MAIQGKLFLVFFHIALLPITTTTLPFPVPTTTLPETKKPTSPLLSSWLPTPSSTKTKLSPFLLPRESTRHPLLTPIHCACSLPFNLFIECHVIKVEHCKTSGMAHPVNEISYDYSWPFYLKHLKHDPSGHLSLSLGLMELLRNSIYRDLARRLKESSLQSEASWEEAIERDPIKEPPLFGSQQLKDPDFQGEPTGLTSLASHANFEEQPEGDIFQPSSKDGSSGDIWEQSAPWRRDLGAPWRRDPQGGVQHHTTAGVRLVEPHTEKGIKSKLRLL